MMKTSPSVINLHFSYGYHILDKISFKKWGRIIDREVGVNKIGYIIEWAQKTVPACFGKIASDFHCEPFVPGERFLARKQGTRSVAPWASLLLKRLRHGGVSRLVPLKPNVL